MNLTIISQSKKSKTAISCSRLHWFTMNWFAERQRIVYDELVHREAKNVADPPKDLSDTTLPLLKMSKVAIAILHCFWS